DRTSLPYVEATLRETLRWFVITPAGKYMRIAHATTEDDVYNGFFIPKSKAIARDESRYQDPHTFNPSRFLTPGGKLNDDNMQYLFGFGQRICPGRLLVEASLLIAVTSILVAVQIRKAKTNGVRTLKSFPN
ncbi:hypothetical protein M422DRAFT_147628, partial [Sphaerobolus stellatus SS14]